MKYLKKLILFFKSIGYNFLDLWHQKKNIFLLLSIAWRNILKRPRQMAIMILVISIGLFGIAINLEMYDGFYKIMTDSIVDTGMGHIQVHKKDYLLKRDIKLTLNDSDKITKSIKDIPGVISISPRILVQGIVSSPQSSYFSQIYGVDPQLEKNITSFIAKPINGKLLKKDDKKGVYIGKALAKKLKVNIGNKIVIMAKNTEGEMEGAAYRVRGIFRGPSDQVEKGKVFISTKAASKLTGIKNNVHEIAVMVDKPKNMTKIQKQIKKKIKAIGAKNIIVENWQELSPILSQQLEASKSWAKIIYIIVFISMSFGIVNAFLMEIFDRIREFGIMMSLGTKPIIIFLTLIFESLFLGILGSIIGVIITVFVTDVILHNQLDLSYFAEGMKYFGFNPILSIETNFYILFECMIFTIIAVILSTLYPAFRAAGFKPIDALRHV